MFSKTIFASAAALAFATSGALAKPIGKKNNLFIIDSVADNIL